MLKKTNNEISIYIGEAPIYPWKEINKARIYLNNKGQIKVCGQIIPDNRHGDFREKFEVLKEYLEKKKLSYDVSKFWKRKLRDIVSEMKEKKQKNISFAKLSDIYYQNYIAEISKNIVKRANIFVKKQYKKELFEK